MRNAKICCDVVSNGIQKWYLLEEQTKKKEKKEEKNRNI